MQRVTYKANSTTSSYPDSYSYFLHNSNLSSSLQDSRVDSNSYNVKACFSKLLSAYVGICFSMLSRSIMTGSASELCQLKQSEIPAYKTSYEDCLLDSAINL